ncbi:MAG: hypothetical protein JRI68_30205 [Deltaproteobacteria bacterium]|nr:hypothetical protein [Deltaproteobacteria bacterium]
MKEATDDSWIVHPSWLAHGPQREPCGLRHSGSRRPDICATGAPETYANGDRDT